MGSGSILTTEVSVKKSSEVVSRLTSVSSTLKKGDSNSLSSEAANPCFATVVRVASEPITSGEAVCYFRKNSIRKISC